MRKALLPIVSIILILLLSTLINFRPAIQPVKAQQQPTQSYSDNFSTDSGLWQYLGSAHRDPTNQYMVLTDTGYEEGGVAFFNYPIQGSFVANFSYEVGGGNCHGDGFTMFFYKQYYTSIGNGGSLAFSPNLQTAPGYGIEFDGWQNPAGDSQGAVPSSLINPPTGDPSNAYIGLIQDIACNHLAYVNDPRVDDGNWHQVSVVVGGSFVSVYVDGGLVLLWDGTLNTTYDMFGFSGATGGTGDNEHIVGNFSITLGPVPTPLATPTPTYVPTPTPGPITTPVSNPKSTSTLPPPPSSSVLSVSNESTSTFSDDFSTDSGQWQYSGTAYRDQTNQYLVLTDTGNYEAGVAFFNHPIQGPFTANFSYNAGGGNCHGDGFTMFFYKQQYSGTPANGGLLAFSTLNEIVPGYGIEFDGWQNIPQDFQTVAGGKVNPPTGDPSSAYIGLIEDSAGNHLAYVNDPRVDDGNWHQVSVVVGTSSVSVYIDQSLVLQWTGVLNRTYDGFGFSGANGEVGDNWHVIDDVSITAQNLEQPTLTASCISAVSQSGLNVQINGHLTFNGAGISGAPILLSYSVTGGQSWQDLTFVYTASDGSYSVLWFPSVTGDYLLKAVYQGDENYVGTTDIINFAMEACTAQSVFSITSNSTLSELYFDSASNELSFNVSGPPGTKGYIYAYIPKSLINDTTGLKVYLDNSQIEYTVQSQSDGWLLYFTYHHSTHTVMISLGSSSANPSPNPTAPEFSSLLTLLLLILLTSSLVIIKIKKNKQVYSSKSLIIRVL
jgi:hypothetical protein